MSDLKLPEGKNKKAIVIGGVVVGGLALFMYVRKRNAANAAAAAASTTDTSGYDPSAIDPNTGLPYGQESGSYYGGTDYGYGYGYVNQGGVATSATQTQYTTNTQWMSDALQDAQNYYGATYSLATSALGKYLSQDPHGLLPDEYSIVSEVVAQIGQPPVGGPFRIIQNNTPPVTTGGGGGGGDNGGGGDGGSEPPPPPPTPTPTPAPPTPTPIVNPNPPTPTPSPPPPPQDPYLHYTSNGTISLNDLARYNNSSPTRIIDATVASEPSDVANYERYGNNNHILPVGTKWNIPRN